MPVTIETKYYQILGVFHFSLMGDDFFVMFSPLKRGYIILVVIIGSNIVCVYTYSYTHRYIYIYVKHIYGAKFC